MTALCGCNRITSVSPDTSKTIVMSPGEMKTFSFTSIASGPLVRQRWHTPTDVDTLRFGSSGAYVFWPNKNNIGENYISFDVQSYLIISIVPPMDKVLWSDSRTWTVIVKGVEVKPFENNVPAVGKSVEYTAKGWPEGNYDYTWDLDGNVVGSGDTYTFTPRFEQIGRHTLNVKAIGEGNEFEHKREIYVPLYESNGHSLFTTLDGGYIIGGRNENNTWYTAIVKLDSYGQEEWSFKGDYNPGYVIPTADQGYIGIERNYYDNPGCNIIKYDGSGHVQWVKEYPDYPAPYLIREVYNNGYIITGYGYSGIEYESYILKIDESGEIEWYKSIDGIGKDIVPMQEDGYLAVGPRSLFFLDSNGNVKSSREFSEEIHSAWPDKDFIKILAGSDLLMKYFDDGTVQKIKLPCIISGGEPTSDGGLICRSNSFITKLNSMNRIEWEREIRSPDYVHQCENGSYLISCGDWATPYVILKLDANGN